MSWKAKCIDAIIGLAKTECNSFQKKAENMEAKSGRKEYCFFPDINLHLKKECVEYSDVKRVILTRPEESTFHFYGNFPEDMVTCSKIWLMKFQVLLAFKSSFSRSKTTRYSATITRNRI